MSTKVGEDKLRRKISIEELNKLLAPPWINYEEAIQLISNGDICVLEDIKIVEKEEANKLIIRWRKKGLKPYYEVITHESWPALRSSFLKRGVDDLSIAVGRAFPVKWVECRTRKYLIPWVEEE